MSLGKRWLWFGFSLFYSGVAAQESHKLAAMAPARLGLASSNLTAPSGASGLWQNPAAINGALEVSIWGAWPWGLKAVGLGGLSLGTSTGSLAIGASLNALTHRLYNETALGIGAAISLGSGTRLGLAGSMYRSQVKGREAAMTYEARWGLIQKVGLHWTLALCGLFSTTDFRPLGRYPWMAGLGFQASESLRLFFSVYRDPWTALDARLGLCWSPLSGLSLYGGVDTATEAIALGLALLKGRWTFRYATALHPLLGETHSMGWDYALRSGANR